MRWGEWRKVTPKIGKLLPTHVYHCLFLVLFTSATKLSHSLTFQELVELHRITGDFTGSEKKINYSGWQKIFMSVERYTRSGDHQNLPVQSLITGNIHEQRCSHTGMKSIKFHTKPTLLPSCFQPGTEGAYPSLENTGILWCCVALAQILPKEHSKLLGMHCNTVN